MTDPDRVALRVLDLPHLGVRLARRSDVYDCPEGVAKDAKSVPLDAFPKVAGGPYRVRPTWGVRPVLARPCPDPKPGGRVLLMLLNHDLLAMYVAIVEPEAP